MTEIASTTASHTRLDGLPNNSDFTRFVEIASKGHSKVMKIWGHSYTLSYGTPTPSWCQKIFSCLSKSQPKDQFSCVRGDVLNMSYFERFKNNLTDFWARMGIRRDRKSKDGTQIRKDDLGWNKTRANAIARIANEMRAAKDAEKQAKTAAGKTSGQTSTTSTGGR